MDHIPTPPSASPGSSSVPPQRPFWMLLAGIVTVVVVAGFAVTIQLARAAQDTHRQHSTRQYSTRQYAAVTKATATDALTPSVGSTPTAAHIPTTARTTPTAAHAPTTAPTATPRVPYAHLVVTANQHRVDPCTVQGASYTVSLANQGTAPVNWTGMFGYPTGGSWAWADPATGTIQPGQTGSFVLTVQTYIGCGDPPREGVLQLSFPAGGSQSSIPLSYAEAGTPPNATVVLTGNQNYVDTCSKGTPSSYPVTLQNTGNVRAYPRWTPVEPGTIGGYGWATVYGQPANTTWIEPGQTITYTIVPISSLTCSGVTYHMTLTISGAPNQGQTFALTDAIAAKTA